MWSERIAAALLVLVGVIHLVPGVVAVAPGRLQSVYGTAAGGRDLELLLRHRAVLLALVGAGLIVAAFVSQVRPVAVVAGAVSMSTFLVLALTVGIDGLHGRTRRIAGADVLALALLVPAAILLW